MGNASGEEPWPKGAWRRGVGPRLLGGGASGIAARTGIDVQYVRLAFIIAALFGGFGVAVYVIAWLLVPATDEATTIGTQALKDTQGIALAAGLGSVVIAVLVVVSFAGAGWIGSLAWPLVITVAGLVLLSRNAPAAEQATLRGLVDPLVGFTGDTT